MTLGLSIRYERLSRLPADTMSSGTFIAWNTVRREKCASLPARSAGQPRVLEILAFSTIDL